jgi:hypothetical protein
MRVIGDVHGLFDQYGLLCHRFKGETTVQIGDMGVGFPNGRNPTIKGDNYFFRGNHDNPAVANSYGNCLGDYGLVSLKGEAPFFFVAGAWSIDKDLRIEGKSWWADEELSIASLNAALDAYIDAKPKIMLTHECPYSVAKQVLNRFALPGFKSDRQIYRTRTGDALQAMFEAHQPELWVFGHYHVDWEKVINGTKFRCLNELSHIAV